MRLRPLAGCNLNCSWCDTPYARVPDEAIEMTIVEVIEKVGGFDCPLVEITGGEPLMQEEAIDLAAALLESGYRVLIETNGSVALSGLDPRVVKIVEGVNACARPGSSTPLWPSGLDPGARRRC